MERRVFLAIFLSFLVLVVYQTWFAPPPPPPQTTQQNAAPAGTTPTPSATATPAPALGAGEPAANNPSAHALVGDTAARDVTVETDAVTAVFNTRGGVLTSYRLKHYRDHDGQPLELLPHGLTTETA